VHVTLDDQLTVANDGTQVIALHEALEQLAAIYPRQAQLVECRFFGGLDVAETAGLMGISESTVLREWRLARAWLAHALNGAE
jgi:DNA-directed RNA polymerase specialized sigma24 family protein